MQQTQRYKGKSLYHKTIDQIEDVGSTSTSNPSDNEEGRMTIENSNDDDHVEDDNAWLSATRTLGSLFLRQEDAERVTGRHVDVFGRPLVGKNINENSFAKHMIDLKLLEEENRERETKHLIIKQKTKESSRETSVSMQAASSKTDKELDDNVSILAVSEQIMKDMSPLSDTYLSNDEESLPATDLLRLSYPEHYEGRIGRDIRLTAVSIAASIEYDWQWKLFFNEGGGVLPLLECIRDGARAVEQGKLDFVDDDVEGTSSLIKERASFAAACTACRALRDLSALSKDFAAVVTDDILNVNSRWSTCIVEGKGYDCSLGGLISDLLILLKHANQGEAFYKAPKKKDRRGSRRTSFSLSNRRRRRDARRRCGLYVVQLMLSMSVASDQAVTALRSTSGLIEAIVECSSYASKVKFKRRWIRKPLNFIKMILPGGQKENETKKKDSWLEPGLTGQMQQNANKLLAAIGHNEWIPKLPGQKGLRILCLDGGGTRGIAAVTTLRHLVDAMGGVEVCDAFDMIVGTSTGAIVAFLVGLRRESALDARIRYDTLIKRIFVKSLIGPIMLATTTASYDESNLMEVLNDILRDDGMLDSRANPAVPLITAVSSKMSASPSQLCLLRNYNYGGGELPDSFTIDPAKARERLGLESDVTMETEASIPPKKLPPIKCAPRTGKGSRYPGSFRVTQKIALRATTAAPTFFKPLLSFDELYCDGGIVASNPSAVAVHEARAVYPDVPLELIVSIGTGAFTEIKVPPRVGWDGVVAQILDSATDAEGVHHILEDIFGEEKTAQHGETKMASTAYFRFNANVGRPDSGKFPIDEINPGRLQELCDIVDDYMSEDEQKLKLKKLGEIIHPMSWLQRAIQCSIAKNV